MYGQQPVQPDMTGMYGQQPVQPDMTGMYGQQPVQPDGGKKPKKPMTKGKLAALIGGGIAIVAAVVCGVIFLPRIFKSDKEVVLDAIEETFDSYIQNDIQDEILGSQQILEKYRTQGGTSESTGSISIGEGNDSNQLGYSVTSAIDQKKKEMSSEYAVTVGDTDLLSVNMYADEDKMYVSVPELLNGYLAYPTDNPLGAMANSPLGESMGLDASLLSGYSMDIFSTDKKNSGVASGYVDALETIWDAAKFEKQGKAKITVNGETITAKEYYVTWSKKDLQDACTSAIDGLTEAVTGSESTLDQLGVSADDYEYYMDQLKAMVPSIIKKDLQFKVYVKGKKAVKLTCKDTLSIMGMVKVDYDFWLDAGDDDLSGNLSFDASGTSVGVKFEAHDINKNTYGSAKVFYGDKEIGVDFTKDVVENGDTVTTTSKVSAASYLSVDIVKNYNKSDNSFDNTISANIVGADTYVVNFKGAFKDIKKGVSYVLDIDSFEVKAANKTICSGSMKQAMDTGNLAVKPMDSSLQVYDVETMTEDVLQEIADESEALIEAWIDKLGDSEEFRKFSSFLENLLGTSYEDDKEDEEPATNEDAETLDDTVSLDDAFVKTGNHSYKIKGCIDGFEFDYADSDGYGVGFTTAKYSSISYSLVEASSLEEALDRMFYSLENIDSYEMLDSQLNQTAKVDGKDVLYSEQKYTAYSSTCQDVTAVVEVEDGVYMCIVTSVYIEDEDYTVEDVLQALSSKYYEVIKNDSTEDII